MPTSAQEFPSVTASVERRFYSRIVPQAPIYIAIDGHDDNLLLNISENGLLVQAPVAVQCNSVARIAIPISGLSKPVQVNVRVVWVNEVNKQTGIQLLDLSEEDREQIRKWGTSEASLFLHRQPSQAGVVATPPARSPARPPVASSLTPSFSTQKISVNKQPGTVPPVSPPSSPEVSTSPAARIALWGMAIAAICFAALFFLRNSLLGNSFPHSREILRQSSAAIQAPARDSQVSPQNPPTAKPDTPATAALASPLGGPASAGHEDTFARLGVGNGANQLDAAPANSTSSAKQTPPHAHAAATSRTITDSRVEPRISSSTTSANAATRDSAAENSATPANSSLGGDATSEASPVGNPVSSKDVETRIPSPVPANASITVISPSPDRNVNSPVIQMDTPARQVIEIHLQRASRVSFFDLPGERVLESRSATIHIQRSVRLPAMHSVWRFNRNKKVVIGGLMSRVDPQLAQAQVSSGDFIRVTAIVNENGLVESVKPIRGRANLIPTVLKAVQEWRYQPTLVDGKPVETKCDVLIQFHGPPRYTARQ